MNLSYFISKKINASHTKTFSAVIYNIAVASIALGLAIVLISFLILMGFRETIKEKIFGFSSHMLVTKYTMGLGYEEQPVSLTSNFYSNYKEQYDFIEHVQPIAYKAGLLKTSEEIHGVLIKGVTEDFNLDRFGQHLVEGSFIDFTEDTYSKEIVISKRIANKLKLSVGDEVIMYFIQDPVRFRKLNISGVYETGMEDFDKKIILGDLDLIRRLNGWADTLASGFEVFIKPGVELEKAETKLFNQIDYDLYVDKATDMYIQIFDWLNLISKNVYIFLVLILFVASFNMVSILFILIIERTQMIGVLKALGATNRQIQRIFIYNGTLITLRGLLWGNAIGILLGLIQDRFKIIPLDPENYSMSYVPIEWNIWVIIGLNAAVFLIVNAVLIIPAMTISNVNPIKAIRFD